MINPITYIQLTYSQLVYTHTLIFLIHPFPFIHKSLNVNKLLNLIYMCIRCLLLRFFFFFFLQACRIFRVLIISFLSSRLLCHFLQFSSPKIPYTNSLAPYRLPTYNPCKPLDLCSPLYYSPYDHPLLRIEHI